MISRDEEFYRGKLRKTLLDHAIVEELRNRPAAAIYQAQRAHIVNPVIVCRHHARLLIGMKKGEHHGARRQQPVQFLHREVEQRRAQVLQRIPHQYAVEVPIEPGESLVEKLLRAGRILLRLKEVAGAAKELIE